jgi:SWI/SNF related-matrix-associated actin-dependent regulator of chromatin subfamily C
MFLYIAIYYTAPTSTLQLKRLELKLKQFAAVETLLLKECEQVERVRQRISADRVPMRSALSGATGTSLPGSTMPSNLSNPASMNPRSMAVPGSMSQASIPAAHTNNMQGQGHQQMSFLHQRQQMLSFGPRLPLSAIQTQPSAQATNIMFNYGMPNSVTPNNHHLLRSSSGNNSIAE